MVDTLAQSYEELGIHIPSHPTTGNINTMCPRCEGQFKNKHRPLSVNLDKQNGNCKRCLWTFGLERQPGLYQVPPKQTAIKKPPALQDEHLSIKFLQFMADRGITKSVIERMYVRSGRWFFEKEEDCIIFPYHANGVHTNSKFRSYDKDFRMVKDASSVLYGHDDIPEEGGDLIWVEGELDKLALASAGRWNVVSVPNGAAEKKFDCLKAAEIQLSKIKRHILAVDNDIPGQGLEQELSRRLGPEKCWRVTWPEGCKDADDVIMKYGPTILDQCLADAKPYPILGIIHIQDLYGSIQYLYHHGLPPGLSTGWKNLDGYYKVREGEFTVITGVPSHGKTAFLTALTLNLMQQHDWPICLCSPEHQPLEDYTTEFLQMITGKPFEENPYTPRMSEKEMAFAQEWLDQYCSFLLPPSKDRTIDKILELAQVQIFRHGIKGLVIDPWSRLNHVKDRSFSTTEYVGQCITKMTDFAKQHHIAIWLAAHPTKLQKELKDGLAQYPVPTAYDISDSAHWFNGADVVLSVWRNVPLRSNRVEVHIQKIKFKKSGKIGKAYLKWNPLTSIFTDDGIDERDLPTEDDGDIEVTPYQNVSLPF